jgi:hypothetical protein
MKLVSTLFLVLIAFSTSARILSSQEVACHKRMLPVFVVDKDGNTGKNLSASDFQLKTRETTMNIAAWTPDTRQHRVVILLDASNSMKGQSGPEFWEAVMAIVGNVAGIKSHNARFALVVFSDRLIETVDFSRGNDFVRERVAELAKDPVLAKKEGNSGSRIFDALKVGFALIVNPTSADSLLVITDGYDEGSETNPAEILNLVSGSMARVFSIRAISPALATKPRSWTLAPDEFDLNYVVQMSGGRTLGPVDLNKAGLLGSSDNPEGRRAFSEQLVQFYRGILQNDLLTIEISPNVKKLEAVRLSFSDRSGGQLDHAQIFYPQEIGPCAGGAVSAVLPGN